MAQSSCLLMTKTSKKTTTTKTTIKSEVWGFISCLWSFNINQWCMVQTTRGCPASRCGSTKGEALENRQDLAELILWFLLSLLTLTLYEKIFKLYDLHNQNKLTRSVGLQLSEGQSKCKIVSSNTDNFY